MVHLAQFRDKMSEEYDNNCDRIEEFLGTLPGGFQKEIDYLKKFYGLKSRTEVLLVSLNLAHKLATYTDSNIKNLEEVTTVNDLGDGAILIGDRDDEAIKLLRKLIAPPKYRERFMNWLEKKLRKYT